MSINVGCVVRREFPAGGGDADGQPKDADWAESLSDIPAEEIRQMARDLAAHRSVLGIVINPVSGRDARRLFARAMRSRQQSNTN